MYALFFALFIIGPALGERCDGGSDEEGEQNSESSRSRSEDSTGTKRRKSRVRKTIRGARERQAFGRLEEVELECRDELVCVEVEEDRSVCQAENPNGKGIDFDDYMPVLSPWWLEGV